MELIKDIYKYFTHRKKYYLLPIVIAFSVVATLIVVSQNYTLGPFIYTLF